MLVQQRATNSLRESDDVRCLLLIPHADVLEFVGDVRVKSGLHWFW